MNIREFLFTIVFILSVCSCKKSNDKSIEDLFLKQPISLVASTIDVVPKLMGNFFSLRVQDSIAILGSLSNDYFYSLVDLKNKKLVKRFGKKGKGPNELQMPFSMTISKGYFSFFDQKKYKTCKLADLISDDIIKFNDEVKLNEDDGSCFFMSSKSNSNTYLATGLFSKGKYSVINQQGNIVSVFGEYMRDEELMQVENTKIGMAYQGEVKRHSKKNKWVWTTISCDLIEVIEQCADNTYDINRFVGYLPEFKIKPGKGIGISPNHDIPLGILHHAITDEYIYVLYSGKSINDHGGASAFEANIIYVFDWKLNPICSYLLDQHIKCFSVTEDNKAIYSVALIGEEQEIVSWEITN